jgi:hypothetical protein
LWQTYVAVVAVGGIGVERDVGDDEQLGQLLLEGTHAALQQSLRVPPAARTTRHMTHDTHDTHAPPCAAGQPRRALYVIIISRAAEDVRLVTGAALDGVVERREEGHTRNAHPVRL